MRFAILSDIHSNLQAWLAVRNDILTHHIDHLIHLGDLVGYGPNPVEVCALTHGQIAIHLLGNHDAAVCERTAMTRWNQRAREMIVWTRRQLSESTRQWLFSLDYTFAHNTFRCVHAEFSSPESFYYIMQPKHAMRSWRAVSEPLLFVGHTHRPALYVLGPSGVPRQVEPQPFEMEPGKRYLINVGSVGFPRDQRTIASYCIFDDRTQVVEWRRVSFDFESYRMAMISRGFAPVEDLTSNDQTL